MNGRTPADDVATRLDDVMSEDVGRHLGFGSRLGLKWDDAMPEDDDQFPWLVVDDEGRRFEIEWDVTVTELTPELVAQRKAFEASWAKRSGESS